jgi:Flp pilus assembly pilin Flp
VSDTSGGTTIEYAMIACFISIGIVGSLTTIGPIVKGFFNSILAGL